MPKLLRLNNFAQKGLNSDLMPWDLSGDYLTSLNNVRILTGKLSPFGGHEVWGDLPVDFDAGFLMAVNSTTGQFWIIAGLDKVYVYDGQDFFDISSTAGYIGLDTPDFWNGAMVSNIPIINHPLHYPEYWPQQATGIQLEPLPWDDSNTWADVSESARIIRSHKQFLFALDLQSGPDEISDGVRWSAPADIGGIPPTWDHLDITNVAGLTNLGGDGGRIIDGLSLRDAFVVYRESGISIFDFAGGPFVWQIRHLSTYAGLISPHAIVEVKGSHYFISDGDILFNDGNTISSLLHNKLRKQFINEYDKDNFLNSYVVKNNVATEIWFCVPKVGSLHPDLAYIYNWEDGSWSVRDIPESTFAAFGNQSQPPLTWGSFVGSWDSALGGWNQGQFVLFDESIMSVTLPAGAGQRGQLLILDTNAPDPSFPFNTTLERLSFALEGLNNVTTITRLYPHMRGPGTVNIEVGSQDHPGAPIRWKAPVAFNADTDRKVDVRTTGELHSFRISSNSGVTGTWDISGFDIEYVNAGVR